jgi:hypothetical protein
MAYAIQLTIGTASKVSLNFQSQEVNVSLTYQLEREDTDVLQAVQERAVEVAEAHRAAWQRIRDVKVERKAEERQQSPASAPHPTEVTSSAIGEATLEAQAAASSAVDEVATAGQQAALCAWLAHWSSPVLMDTEISYKSEWRRHGSATKAVYAGVQTRSGAVNHRGWPERGLSVA